MRLDKWFDQQRDVELSDMQKMRIYQKYLDTSHRSLSYHKVAYYTKLAVFSFGLFLLGGAIYYSTQPTSAPYEIGNQAFVAVQPQQGGNYVQASTIGEIISTQGEVKITHNNTELETNMLKDNDTVVLAEGAEMHFSVRDDAEAKIIGPATFSLEYRGQQNGINTYAINLIEGDYLEIISAPIVESQEMLPPVKDQIIVQAPDFSLEKVHARGSFDVVISTNAQGKKEVENKGSEVVIKKIVSEKQTYVAVQQHQKVAIHGDVKLIEERVAVVVDDIKQDRLEVKYELTPVSGSSDTGNILENLLDDVLPENDKIVIDETTYTSLMSAIRPNLLQKDIAQVEQYYLEGDENAFTIAYANLLSKLQRGYTAVGFAYTAPASDISGLSVAAGSAEYLARTLSDTYYIDPSDLGGLWTVGVSLYALIEQPFGTKEVIDTSASVITSPIESPELDAAEEKIEEAESTEEIEQSEEVVSELIEQPEETKDLSSLFDEAASIVADAQE